MFFNIFLYEIKSWLKKPSIYIYFMAFFSLAFISFAGTAGFFDPPSSSKSNEPFLNSPFEINYMFLYFNKVFLFLLPTIIGASIHKDFKHKVHHILYSFPIQKKDYLLGKFLSALCIVFLVTLSVGIGIGIAEHLPNLNKNMIGDFKVSAYLQTYLIYTFPNMLIYGLIIFSTVLWTRNIYAGFGVVVGLFFLQIIFQNAFHGNGYLIALSDPFAQNTSRHITHLWTIEEKNSLMIPITGVVILNRLLWLGIAASIFMFTYRKFSFSQEALSFSKMKKKGKRAIKDNFNSRKKVSLPSVSFNYSFLQQLKNCWAISNVHFKYIILNKMFLGMVTLGIAAIIFALAKVTNKGDMTLLPVTRLILSIPSIFFYGIIVLLTFIYSGMLVHRERMIGMDQLADATAIPDHVMLGSKFIAIIKMQAALLLVMILAGISLQLYNGYYHLEIGLYIFHLFGISFISLIIWALASMFIHSLLPNVYLGMFTLIMGWIGVGGLEHTGIKTKLIAFNLPEQFMYTDLNQYGNSLAPYYLIEFYWLTFGILLLIIAYLLWHRGLFYSFKERLNVANLRFNNPLKTSTAILFLSFILLAFNIHQKEKKTYAFNKVKPKEALKQFKDNFKQYKNTTQPRITSLYVELDLFPKENNFKAKGKYILKNKSDKIIDTLLIKNGFDEITTFNINRKNSIVTKDDYFQFHVIHLENGLLPNDSLELNFTVRNKDNTFFERNSNVLRNGTMLQHDIFPRLGYIFNAESHHPDDFLASCNHYHALDSDYINFETIVSTSAEQTAIAPGTLLKQWTENGRQYFHYKLDNKIKYSLGYNSGKFEQKSEKWKDVNLNIYYHKTHDQNLESMMDGLKAALEYNSQYFGAYQHKEANIIEFPHSEGTFATSYGNSIPMSEFDFIHSSGKHPNKVNVTFYIPAHELTHQWWGSQLTPADALGATMLSESITEFTTLNMYRKHYGIKKALQFLKFQRQRYLQGRTREQEEELPLYLVKSKQQYIAYGKGTMAFHTLGHYWGEDNLNATLKAFLLEYKFKESPYPTSLDFLQRLKADVPDSLQYIIKDMFETVTFYDNSIEKAITKELPNGTHQVDVELSILKYRNTKKDEPLPLNDFMEIGFYDKNGELFQVERIKITERENILSFVVDEKSSKVILDPNYLGIEREIGDNEFIF